MRYFVGLGRSVRKTFERDESERPKMNRLCLWCQPMKPNNISVPGGGKHQCLHFSKCRHSKSNVIRENVNKLNVDLRK